MREKRTRIPTWKQLFIVTYLLIMVIFYTYIVISCLEYYTGEEDMGYSPHPLYPVAVFAPCCYIFLIIVLIVYVANIVAERKMARQLLFQSPSPFCNPPYQSPYQSPYTKGISKCQSCGGFIEKDAVSCLTCGETIKRHKLSSDSITERSEE